MNNDLQRKTDAQNSKISRVKKRLVSLRSARLTQTITQATHGIYKMRVQRGHGGNGFVMFV
jgi:hypothetical protein